MSEETFFAALRDHLPRYTLTVTYSQINPLAPYAVELFARGESFRCKGFTPCECFSSILYALGIPAAPASTARPDARAKQNENVITHLRDHGPEYP
jgi:hypothetical protein